MFFVSFCVVVFMENWNLMFVFVFYLIGGLIGLLIVVEFLVWGFVVVVIKFNVFLFLIGFMIVVFGMFVLEFVISV